ncbi:MAG: TRAM domain-containing protein, partial [Candidatus Omnitrophica bacterium]|nr:TRAM domain-containing protein [Candidatus Omnitrophota bacterium]
AFNFKSQVTEKVKRERFDAVMTLQQEISRDVDKKFLGKALEVLIDDTKGGVYTGRTQYDAPEVDGIVYVDSSRSLKPGDLVKVEIKDTLEYDLTGKALR